MSVCERGRERERNSKKMCQGHCAVGVNLNGSLYIRVNILIASIAVVCGVELNALAAEAFLCMSEFVIECL